MLGLVETRQSRFAEAERDFNSALSLKPDNARVLGYLGTSYLREGRFEAAASMFERVLRLDPGNPGARYNAGLAAMATGKPAVAKTHFEAALAGRPDNTAARVELLRSELYLKDAKAVDEQAAQLNARLPPGAPERLRVAALLTEHGQYRAAIPVLESLKAARPSSFDIRHDLALAYFRAGRYEEAAQTLAPVPAGAPGAEALNLLGDIEQARQRPAAAAAAYRAALERDANNENFRFDYGRALLDEGKLDEAAEVFRGGPGRELQSWRLRMGLGAAQFLSGNYDEAAATLLQVAEAQPRLAVTFYLLGRTYEGATNQRDRIAAALERYLQRNPGEAWAWSDVGRVLYLMAQTAGHADLERARQHLERAVELDPKLAEAWLTLASVAQSQGRMDDSIQLLQQAFAANPGLASAHYKLGLAYRKRGLTDKAKAEFEAFQKLKSSEKADEDKQVLMRLRAPADAGAVQTAK